VNTNQMTNQTWRRRLILASTILLMAAGPSTPESRMNNSSWAAHFARKQRELQRQHYDIVFFGDSITRELDTGGAAPWSNIRVVWQRWFACHRAIELGFSGDTTANLLWRIENGLMPATPPKVAILLIGANNNRPDLGWSAQQTASAIIEIAGQLHQRMPGTHILVMGETPNGHGPRINGIIDQVNATLAATNWAPYSASYVPLADLFAQNGKLDTDLFREPRDGRPGLHPDAAGWERIAERIAPLIAQYTGVPPGPCPGAPAAP
jgi:lysophospholipase L1-like esterase